MPEHCSSPRGYCSKDTEKSSRWEKHCPSSGSLSRLSCAQTFGRQTATFQEQRETYQNNTGCCSSFAFNKSFFPSFLPLLCSFQVTVLPDKPSFVVVYDIVLTLSVYLQLKYSKAQPILSNETELIFKKHFMWLTHDILHSKIGQLRYLIKAFQYS